MEIYNNNTRWKFIKRGIIMKFMQSNLAKKLIIILIVLMIFNIAIPREVKAWDLGGILLKPISSMILSVLVSIDTTIGLTLNGISIATDVLGSLIDLITKDNRECT